MATSTGLVLAKTAQYCSDIPDATGVDCLNPWGLGCSEPTGFEPHRLWNITLNIWNRCPTDNRLWSDGKTKITNSNASLTNAACEAITGPHLNRALNATKYANQDIWGRLSTWKFPLFQLVASSPRPPLTFGVEGFAIAHLMGDPIGSIRDFISKLSSCQLHATYWQNTFRGGMDLIDRVQSEREAKAFAMLTVSYDEWGEGENVRKILRTALDHYVLRAHIERLHNPTSEARFGEIEPSLQVYKAVISHDLDTEKQFQDAFDVVMKRRREMEEKARHSTTRNLSLSVPQTQLSPSRLSSDQEDTSLLTSTTTIEGKPELQELATFLRLCNQTSDALAADRATKILPIFVAQLLFVGAVAIALVKTVSDDGATLLINIEAHSIAFSALYFWILPAVFLSSVIGVSQTENAMPRILDRFRTGLVHELKDHEFNLPDWKTVLKNVERRVENGGVYSWNPRVRPGFNPHQASAPKRQRGLWGTFFTASCTAVELALPEIWVISGTVIAMTVSVYVPPEGWEARHCAQATFLLLWVLSYLITVLIKRICSPTRGNNSWCFRITYAKDVIVGLAVIGGIIVTQIGIFNKCSSYTRWGRVGLFLPDQPDGEVYLRRSIHSTYIIITCFGIGPQMLLPPMYIWAKYRAAVEVFNQRDDGKEFSLPRLPWFHSHRPLAADDIATSIPTEDLEARTYVKSETVAEGDVDIEMDNSISGSMDRGRRAGHGRHRSLTPIADSFTIRRKPTPDQLPQTYL